jgi:integrase
MLDDLQLPRQADWMPYILRRSLATELRGRRVDPWDLAGFMGHRVVGTTEIYTGGGLYSTVTSALSEILSEIEAKAPGALLPGSLGKGTLLPGSPTGLAG